MSLRVVLHVHSTWSYDGRWSLPALARLYGSLGVDAVLMTEHDTGFEPAAFDAYRDACLAASTHRCLLIPGIEYSSPDNAVHLLTWGLPRVLPVGAPTLDTLRRVADEGGVAVLAHPIRREAWRRFESTWTPLLSGIELWNRKSDGLSWGAEARDLLAATALPATVGQDFHALRHLYPLTHRFDGIAPGSPAAIEGQLVEGLRGGRSVPEAFRRPLLDDGRAPVQEWHPQAEGIRRRLRSLVRRRSG